MLFIFLFSDKIKPYSIKRGECMTKFYSFLMEKKDSLLKEAKEKIRQMSEKKDINVKIMAKNLIQTSINESIKELSDAKLKQISSLPFFIPSTRNTRISFLFRSSEYVYFLSQCVEELIKYDYNFINKLACLKEYEKPIMNHLYEYSQKEIVYFFMDGSTIGPNHKSIPLSFSSFQFVKDLFQHNTCLYYGYEPFYDKFKQNVLVEYISQLYFILDPEKTHSYTEFSDTLSEYLNVEEKVDLFLESIGKEFFKSFFESYVEQDSVLEKRWKKERIRRLTLNEQ